MAGACVGQRGADGWVFDRRGRPGLSECGHHVFPRHRKTTSSAVCGERAPGGGEAAGDEEFVEAEFGGGRGHGG